MYWREKDNLENINTILHIFLLIPNDKMKTKLGSDEKVSGISLLLPSKPIRFQPRPVAGQPTIVCGVTLASLDQGTKAQQ